MYDMDTKRQILLLIESTSKKIGRIARQHAPVGPTGNLKGSIRMKMVKDRTGFHRTVVPRKPKGSHRHLVAYGTNNRITKKTKAFRGRVAHGNDFMGAAQQAVEGEYNARLQAIVGATQTI